MKITNGKQQGPRRVLYHGANWIGKTTFAAQAVGGCLLFNLEDDRDADMAKTPVLRTLESFDEAWQYCDTESQKPDWPFRWIAIDTLDALQVLIEKAVCKRENAESMGDKKFSYKVGEKLIDTQWQKIKFKLDWLHSERNMGIIMLAHSDSRKVSPPDAQSYDRQEPAITQGGSDLLCDWAQEVFYGSFRTYVVGEDAGFNRTRNMAAGGTERVTRCQPTAGIRAKNRLNMPDEIANFQFADYAKFFMKAPQGVPAE